MIGVKDNFRRSNKEPPPHPFINSAKRSEKTRKSNSSVLPKQTQSVFVTFAFHYLFVTGEPDLPLEMPPLELKIDDSCSAHNLISAALQMYCQRLQQLRTDAANGVLAGASSHSLSSSQKPLVSGVFPLLSRKRPSSTVPSQRSPSTSLVANLAESLGVDMDVNHYLLRFASPTVVDPSRRDGLRPNAIFLELDLVESIKAALSVKRTEDLLYQRHEQVREQKLRQLDYICQLVYEQPQQPQEEERPKDNHNHNFNYNYNYSHE